MNFLKILDNSKSWLKRPNDRAETYITPSGNNVITKIHTSEIEATLREYYKKDGTPGKKTLLFKEV